MAFSEPLEHDVASIRKHNFLTIGSEPSRIRVAGHRQANTTTEVMRTEAFTDQLAIFVTTKTELINVVAEKTGFSKNKQVIK